MKILKKSKQEQGITLIALVVTIIVLLILAGVTISAVLGENGLVQKAKKATQAHQNAVITENNQMNNASNFINTLANNDSQDDEEDEGEWWIPTEAELAELQAAGAISEETGITVGSNVDPASASALSNGTKLKVITIMYHESFPNYYATNFIEATIGGSYSDSSCCLTKKVLDEVIKRYEDGGMTNAPAYGIFKNATQVPFWFSTDNTISYECPFNLDEITYYVSQSYYNRVMSHIRSAVANPTQLLTLSAVETLLGYTGNTNSNDLVVGDHINYYYAKGTDPIECVVLYKDDTHGIQVVSADTVGSNITLGSSDFDTSKSSYNSAVSTLNAAANSYVPEGGMATDGRCVGSNPLIGQKNSAESNAMMTASNDPTGSERAWMTSNGWYNSFKLGDEYYSEDYNTMKNMTTPIHNLSNRYWLASRSANADSNVSGFNVRNVDSFGNTKANALCAVNGSGNAYSYSYEFAFRPVFLLKSDIPVEKIS